jgi:hypothetical protein
MPSNPTPEQLEDENFRRRYRATNAIQYYLVNRRTTNFPFFLASAEAEQLPMTVEARKVLWQGEQARKLGEPLKAIRLYKEGLERWKQVVTAEFKTFYRPPPPDRGDRAEEETYEYELAYQRLLVQYDERVREAANEVARAIQVGGALARFAPFRGVPFPRGGEGNLDPFWNTANREELKWFVVENVGNAPFSSPFVGSLTAEGTPWIQEDTKEMVRQKQGVSRAKPPAHPPGVPPGQMPQPNQAP